MFVVSHDAQTLVCWLTDAETRVHMLKEVLSEQRN